MMSWQLYINCYIFSINIISVGALDVRTSVNVKLGKACAICGCIQVTFQKRYQIVHKKQHYSRNFYTINQFLMNIKYQFIKWQVCLLVHYTLKALLTNICRFFEIEFIVGDHSWILDMHTFLLLPDTKLWLLKKL